MNLGDVTDNVVPKMFLLAPPVNGGAICTRSFIPKVAHASIGVLAAVTVRNRRRLPRHDPPTTTRCVRRADARCSS